jgi:Kef-type K+ transport system membrane component KefB
MNNIFLELTVLLITAGAISVIVSMLKQPSIIAYLLTGILIGTFGVNLMPHNDILQGLSQVGVTLLLFMIGLELDLGQLKALGRHQKYRLIYR